MCIFRPSPLLAMLIGLLSGPSQAMDLMQAWQAASQHDPSLRAAEAGARTGEHQQAEARALGMPQVTLQAGAGVGSHYNKISDARFAAPAMGAASGATFTTENDHAIDLQWQIRAEHALYNAETAARARQLGKQAELAQIRLDAEQQQLMLKVARAYLDTLLADDTRTTLQAQKALVAETLKIAQARFDAGDAAVIDTHEARARNDMLDAQLIEAESTLQLARAQLADLTGDTESPLARMQEHPALGVIRPGQLQDWLTQAQSNNPALLAQHKTQAIREDEIDKYRQAHAPTLNLVAEAGMQNMRGLGRDGSELARHDASIGLALTIPLFTGGMREARLGEALANSAQAGFEADALRLKAGQEARTAWQGVTVGLARIKALEQALVSSQTRLDATRLGQEVGDRTGLDVLNAEQEHFSTRQSLYQTRYQLVQAYLALYASSGALNESVLADINTLFK